MADNKKIYTIQINGIDQSIKQVDALSDSLQFLDKKINELESRSVSITSSNNGGGGNRIAELSTEDNLLKQIQSTEQKIIDTRREDYQSLLAQKELLKDITDEAKQRAAAENLSVGNYGNTINGLKQELADIKTVMQSTDLGSGKFNELNKRASELTNKLKELDQSYGQFGRNAGNNPGNISEGFSKLQIEVNGVTREFDNARQALKELTNERNTLKLMGQDVGDLDEVVKTLKSDIKDMEMSSAAMDNLLDSMEGLIALGSTAEGFASLFGFDNGAIEETIQKLVALQNILQGIEVIKRQMKTGEGIGGMLAKGDAAIDSFTKKLFGVNTAAKTTNATLATTSTAGKSAATGLATASAAANTATKSFSLASATATALRVALSAIGIGLVIGAISLLIEGISALISKQSEAKKYQEDLNKATESGQKAYADAQGELIKYQVKLDKFNGSKKEEKKLVDELNSKYGQSLGTYKSLAEWKKILKERGEILCQVMLKEAEAQAILNMYTEAYVRLQQAKKIAAEGGDTWEWLPWNWGGKSAKQKADENVKAIEDQMTELHDKIANIYKDIEELNQNNNLFDYAPQIEKNGKSNEKATKKAEESLIKLRLELMKDGLAKTLAQLKAERAARIKEARETGSNVREQEALINALYDRKEIEARKAHYNNLLSIQRKYQDNMKKVQEQTNRQKIDNSRTMNQNKLDSATGNPQTVMSNTLFKYLTIDYAKTDVHKSFNEYNKDVEVSSKLTKEEFSKMVDIFKNNIAMIKVFENRFGDAMKMFEKDAEGFITSITFDGDTSKVIQDQFRELAEQYNEALYQIKDISDKYPQVADAALHSEFAVLKDAFDTRYASREAYYKNLLKASKEYYDKELVIQKTAIDEQIEADREAEEKRHRDMAGNSNPTLDKLLGGYNQSYDSGELAGMDTTKIEEYFSKYKEAFDNWLKEQDQALKKGEISIEEYTEKTSGTILQSYKNQEITFVQFLDLMRQENETHQNKMSVINKQAEVETEHSEKEHLKKMQQANAEYYSNMRKELSNYISSISKQRDKAEVNNAWGIINYGKTKTALENLKDNAENAMMQIANQKNELVDKLSKGEISFGDFDTAMTELNALGTEAMETAESVKQDLNNLIGDFWGSINEWVQQVGQTMNSILGSLSEIQSNKYDKMIEQQEKYIEKYEELLNKQKDITQEHASAVESIENELSTARGDRRQQLIDMLNAEMAAQRASLEQQKKIEREKQKAEDKKKKLEHDQAVAKKKMQLAQAAINMAMAISMAAVNSWPIPAIPMMALASAAGAAQIAAIQSQNIPSYGSGGVIQGKSHREGGVKVLGGRAEVEGGEYITNKVTTSKNVDLLEYINSKKKRINLDDLIEFYGGSSPVKKNIQTVRTKFADGGVVPTLRNDINLSDRLLTAFEDYSNRPTVVSVVDIIDRTQKVNDVRVMAGLDA